MTKFTQVVVALFVAFLFVGAVLMASNGKFSGAIFLIVIAMFFVIVARMATFEARYGIAKPEPGTPRADLTTQVKRLWNAPGLEGKFYVVFLATVLSIWLLQQVLGLILKIAK
ncbi:hypothetical protein [Variovorax sp. HJSM1_2]|uniref:hypothetical protein n=1 Tax=Variovorax sp. HJSM1_2 TaxID=3366263 RepID=UPI003BCD01F2